MKTKERNLRRRVILLGTICICSLIFISPAFSAEKFPSKSITLVCPWSPGGAADTVSRLIASISKDYLNEPVVVMNKVGGNGAVGHTAGATAKPDGYTVTMMTIESILLSKTGTADVSYKDFQPLMQITFFPAGVSVLQEVSWKTLQEFVTDAKKNPEKFSAATLGPGGIWTLACEGLEQKAGIKLKKIPFDGAGPGITALLGGHVDITTGGLAEAWPNVQAGKLRALGVMSEQRVRFFKDIPTLKEQGYDVVVGSWMGLSVPKGTPMDRCKILVDAFQKTVQTPQFKELLEKRTFELQFLGPDEWAKSLAMQDKFYGALLGK
jgi:tripartite-type tricarboxylate transporter receptor subunit TctC